MKRQPGKYPEFIAVRLGTEMRNALERIAAEEDRAIGYIIRRIVQEWLEAQALAAREKKGKKRSP